MQCQNDTRKQPPLNPVMHTNGEANVTCQREKQSTLQFPNNEVKAKFVIRFPFLELVPFTRTLGPDLDLCEVDYSVDNSPMPCRDDRSVAWWRGGAPVLREAFSINSL
ncbi:hypothetical protein BDBG_04386 [Blastomyces gilchristii SLH14081]|uniref:Uncharacterized protein n=1 Tax=Blastomyces gilchristii (strain SLH14081) TaxID=559298 RepID=A0A179UMK4_BLAGS|nr:uncharacterized protein BDBG_04386 [Blastomyces gilchristii SLH14081]OAT08439.1 hypothetical protein BDBG_04386 [Blastomyces gilchristii SLH14081]